MVPFGDIRFLFSISIVIILLSGCVTGSYVSKDDKKHPKIVKEFESWKEIREIYRLQKGDLLEIAHPYASDMDRQVRILPDGRIFLPLVGGVEAADLIPEQLVTKIETSYKQQKMKDPSVTVIPIETNPQKVFVGGQVLKPGVYDYTDRIGVVEAIFMAGGSLNTAEESQVVLLRRTIDDKAMIRTIDVAALLSGKGLSGDVPLHQYDIVYVPRSTAAEIGKFVEQYITNILPFSRSFSYSLNRDLN